MRIELNNPEHGRQRSIVKLCAIPSMVDSGDLNDTITVTDSAITEDARYLNLTVCVQT